MFMNGMLQTFLQTKGLVIAKQPRRSFSHGCTTQTLLKLKSHFMIAMHCLSNITKMGLSGSIFHGVDVALVTLAFILRRTFGEDDIGGEDLVARAVLALEDH